MPKDEYYREQAAVLLKLGRVEQFDVSGFANVHRVTAPKGQHGGAFVEVNVWVPDPEVRKADAGQ